MKKFFKILLKIFGSLLLLVIFLLAVVRVALVPRVTQRLVDYYAPMFIEGEVKFRGFDLSLRRSYPFLEFSLDSLCITYPAERYAEQKERASRMALLGSGEKMDTLAFLGRLSVSVDVKEYYDKGKIMVPHLDILSPRIYLHTYEDGSSNLDIIKALSDTAVTSDADSSAFSLPEVIIGGIALEKKPRIVYTSAPDTLDLNLRVETLTIGSDLNVRRMAELDLGTLEAGIDSVRLSGRYGRDSLRLNLERLNFRAQDSLYDISVKARTMLATRDYGRIKVPISLDAALIFPEKGNYTNVIVQDFSGDVAYVPLSLKGKIEYNSLEDIYVDLNAGIPQVNVRSVIDNIKGMLPIDTSILSEETLLSLDLKAKGRYTPESLPQINARAMLLSLNAHTPDDSMHVYSDTLRLIASTRKALVGEHEHIAQGTDIMELEAETDSLSFVYLGSARIETSDFHLHAQAAQEAIKLLSEGRLQAIPVHGHFHTKYLRLESADSMRVTLRSSENSFSLQPKKSNPLVPVLSLSSSTDRIRLGSNVIGRAGMSDLRLTATAAMNSMERRSRMFARRDSLAAAHPDVPKDSLYLLLPLRERSSFQTDALRSHDIRLDLGETFTKYFREWDIEARASLGEARLMSHIFPIRTRAGDVSLHFDNNSVSLDSLTLEAGRSLVKANGQVNGLRGMLLGRQRNAAKLTLSLAADTLDVDELLAAYSAGTLVSASKDITPGLSDDELERQIIEAASTAVSMVDTLESEALAAIVLPKNLEVEAYLSGNDIRVMGLDISDVRGGIDMANRSLRLSGAQARTAFGKVRLDAGYDSRDADTLSAGVRMRVDDLDVESLIAIVPAVDTLVPMIKSLHGTLGADLSMSLQLDTAYTPLLETARGVVDLRGEDILLDETQAVRDVIKLLKFDDIKEIRMKKLKVDAKIEEGLVTLYPFLIDIDRYKVALSGYQRLNGLMSYHVSVIQSPAVVRLGADVSGHYKRFKLSVAMPKYKSTKLPDYSEDILQMQDSVSYYIQHILE